MAASYLGTISEFSSGQETWTAYVERLVQYLVANKVEDADQRRAVLLSVCGPATYRLIRNLVSPKRPTELKFAEIVEIVQKHHDPKPSVIVPATLPSNVTVSIHETAGLENLWQLMLLNCDTSLSIVSLVFH